MLTLIGKMAILYRPPYYYNIVVEITKDQKSLAQTNADCAKDLLRAFHQARDAFFATQRPVVGVTHPNYYIQPFKPKAACAGLAA